MWTPGAQTPPPDEPRRRAQRHRTDSITCDLGSVVDLSTLGMRVSSSKKPPLRIGETGIVKLKIPEGSLTVNARTVWLRRTGFRRYEMGMEFYNLKRGVIAALDRLARFGFLGVGNAAVETIAANTRAKTRQKVRATLNLPDYYGVLGVASNATDEQIREAYRTLARQLHPDAAGDRSDVDRFAMVQEAYGILKDGERRRRYDYLLAG